MPKYTLPGEVMRQLAWKCIEWANANLSRSEIMATLTSVGIADWEAERIYKLAIRLQHDYPGYTFEPSH